MPNTPQRTLHLVDVENIIGSPRPCRSQVAECRRAYVQLAQVAPSDHVIVACNHGAAITVGSEWTGARLLARSGTDGADHALLEVIKYEQVDERFSAIVLASGDGIFTDAISRLAGQGVAVTVVSRPRSLSRRLRLAAGAVVYFIDGPVAPAGESRLRETA